ncbi:hypothetical protein PIB30_046634, partial [Stylosanthes scabra]|nr:hypothetical protein [Stylosanthes scabra]
MARLRSPRSFRITTYGLCPSSAWHQITRSIFCGTVGGWIRDDLWDRLVEFWRQEDFKKLKQVNKRNKTSSTGKSLYTGNSTTYKATRESMSEVFARTHTRKEDRLSVDKRSEDVS